jgi:hypothetical protein
MYKVDGSRIQRYATFVFLEVSSAHVGIRRAMQKPRSITLWCMQV